MASLCFSFHGVFIFFCLAALFMQPYSSIAEPGTASQYGGPPYQPAACFGGDVSQLPSDDMFAAAGSAVWDAPTCGTDYIVTCVGAPVHGACIPDQIIKVKIVDRATALTSRPSWDGATLVLSPPAFSKLVNTTQHVSWINIDYQKQ